MSAEAYLFPADPGVPSDDERRLGMARNAGLMLVQANDALREGLVALQTGDFSTSVGDDRVTRACVDMAWECRTASVERMCDFVGETYQDVFAGLGNGYSPDETVARRTHAWNDTWWRLFGALASAGSTGSHSARVIEATAQVFDYLSKEHHRGPYGAGRFHAHAREHDTGTRIFYEVFGDFLPRPPRGGQRW